MSDTKWPDGPWSFVPSIPEEGVECFWIESSVQQIASVYGPQNEQQEAVARLTAAAPDLYWALCDMVSDHESISQGTLDFAKRALAKARGENNG